MKPRASPHMAEVAEAVHARRSMLDARLRKRRVACRSMVADERHWDGALMGGTKLAFHEDNMGPRDLYNQDGYGRHGCLRTRLSGVSYADDVGRDNGPSDVHEERDAWEVDSARKRECGRAGGALLARGARASMDWGILVHARMDRCKVKCRPTKRVASSPPLPCSTSSFSTAFPQSWCF